MEKVKTFAIVILTISLLSTYFIICSLWIDNRILKFKVYDLESALRVHQRIQETGKNGG
jgi:hypothetical protein